MVFAVEDRRLRRSGPLPPPDATSRDVETHSMYFDFCKVYCRISRKPSRLGDLATIHLRHSIQSLSQVEQRQVSK